MHLPRHLASRIETLEPRIAPATLVSVSADHKTATWTDVDGDRVTLKASKPVLDAADFTFLPDAESDIGGQLALLDLSDIGAANSGVSLAFTAKRNPIDRVGDGSVHVGRIAAAGVDLGKVSIPGDLGSIEAGDSTLTTLAVKSILTRSAAAFGIDTQGDELKGELTHVGWLFEGKVGKITVQGHFRAVLEAGDSEDSGIAFDDAASIGAITIWGDLIGGGEEFSPFEGAGTGYIFAEGHLGKVTILGSVDGSSSDSFYGGSVTALGEIASVSVGGHLRGGSAPETGEIFAVGALGKVTIGGSIFGGFTPTDENGDVFVDEEGVPFITESAGAIGSSMSIDAVTVRGDVIPGYGRFTGAIYTSEQSGGNIKSVTIGGTLYGYNFQSFNNGDLESIPAFNGIYADGRLGPVKVGSIVGSAVDAPVPITALGKANPSSAKEALAIASITVLRDAFALEVLAGYDSNYEAINPDVTIGPIKIGNSLRGSSISAGVVAPIYFGLDDNEIGEAGVGFTDSAVRSRIVSLTVGTYVEGSGFMNGAFPTGMVAQEIGAVKIGGSKLELSAGSSDLFTLGRMHDFFVREVA
jgi:hypothetical protein